MAIKKVSSDGTQSWLNDGYQHHREDGPACLKSNGARFWLLTDEWHRDDGPAVIRVNAVLKWFQDGKLHRKDGPAVIRPDGTAQYWIRGEPVEPFTGVYVEKE